MEREFSDDTNIGEGDYEEARDFLIDAITEIAFKSAETMDVNDPDDAFKISRWVEDAVNDTYCEDILIGYWRDAVLARMAFAYNI